MNFKVIIILSLVAVVLARPQRNYNRYDSGSDEDAKYSFEWSAEDDSSESHFGQHESRDGDRTEGSYYVRLADSRLMKVTYYVDGDSGFVATVEYEGEAKYDSSSEEE